MMATARIMRTVIAKARPDYAGRKKIAGFACEQLVNKYLEANK
jgi:hypothetical protein